jgi:hypothetical protein
METIVTRGRASRVLPLLLVMLVLAAAREVTGQTPPTGEAVMAWPITIAPSWSIHRRLHRRSRRSASCMRFMMRWCARCRDRRWATAVEQGG